MKKERILISVLLIVSCVMFSCSNKVQDEFLSLIESNKSQNEIVSLVKDFEINHPKHFESKLYLAEYFISIDDVGSAFEYLKRAEITKKNAVKNNRDVNFSRMYGNLAIIHLSNGELEIAEEYVTKAIKYDKKQNLGYEYILGHIYVLKEDNQNALEIFNDIYSRQPNIATSSDLQTFMYLLADSENYEKCIEILNVYFETGKWFMGLGSFSSTVFEKAGMLQEAILCAFLEYEYYSSMTEPDDEKYLENLSKVEEMCINNGSIDVVSPIISLIKNLYTKNETLSDSFSSNFISKYLVLKNKINEKNISIEEFAVLLSLETYFQAFPSYYWAIWEGVKIVDNAHKKDYVPVLKKIIALSPSSVLATKARNEVKFLLDGSNPDNTDLDYLLF